MTAKHMKLVILPTQILGLSTSAIVIAFFYKLYFYMYIWLRIEQELLQ